MIDLAAYVGLPYRDRGRDRSGVDCYGLVRLVYLEQMGVRLPSLVDTYRSAADRVTVAATIGANGTGAERWRAVERAPLPGDVAVLAIGGWPAHCGISDGNGWLLHSLAGHDAVMEPVDGTRWRSRLVGYWRHVG